MVHWIDMLKMTEQKLNRELEKQEVDFLKWLYKKQKEEIFQLK